MGLHEEISELERRFAEAPDSRLFLPLADALRRAGELDRAVKLCRDGLERYPDFNSARILLGECLADMGELEQAGEVLQEAAVEDGENRRIAERLSEISGHEAGLAGGPVETEATAADELEAAPEEEEPDGSGMGKGEKIATGTLGGIYESQGHDREAFEVYSKLVAEGKADQAAKEKLRELAVRLGEELPGEEARKDGGGAESATAGQDTPVLARAEAGEGRFEERIDKIFHFLLGDSPEHAELERSSSSSARTAPSGSSGFVDMLEDWIDDIRQGK